MPNKKQGTYLGFDFGTKRVGVAVGQTITQTAQPLTVLPADNGRIDPKAIAALIKEYAPVGFVTGLPLTPEGNEEHIAHAAKKFAHRLQANFNLPSHVVDERMTTQIARRLNTEQPLDAVAAALILESWLILRQ